MILIKWNEKSMKKFMELMEGKTDIELENKTTVVGECQELGYRIIGTDIYITPHCKSKMEENDILQVTE